MYTKITATITTIIACSLAHSDEYYLQSDNSATSSDNWNNGDVWFDATTGGSTLNTNSQTFAANDFYLQEYNLDAVSSSAFVGNSLNMIDQGALIDIMTNNSTHSILNTFNFGAGTVRLHSGVSNATLDIGTLAVAPSSSGLFRAPGSKTFNISANTLTGSGTLTFGNVTTTSELGFFNFGATNTTGFTGVLDVVSTSTVEFTSSDFGQAGLSFNDNSDDGSHTINLVGNVFFDRLINNGVEDTTLIDGTSYGAADLNAIYSRDVFSGAGTITIGTYIPEPSSYALIIGACLLMVRYVSRRGSV